MCRSKCQESLVDFMFSVGYLQLFVQIHTYRFGRIHKTRPPGPGSKQAATSCAAEQRAGLHPYLQTEGAFFCVPEEKKTVPSIQKFHFSAGNGLFY